MKRRVTLEGRQLAGQGTGPQGGRLQAIASVLCPKQPSGPGNKEGKLATLKETPSMLSGLRAVGGARARMAAHPPGPRGQARGFLANW